MLVLANSSVFSTGHIVFTGVISGVIAAVFAALWLRGENRMLDSLAIGVLTARRGVPAAKVGEHAPAQRRRPARLLRQRLARTDGDVRRPQRVWVVPSAERTAAIRAGARRRDRGGVRGQRRDDLSEPCRAVHARGRHLQAGWPDGARQRERRAARRSHGAHWSVRCRQVDAAAAAEPARGARHRDGPLPGP